MARIARAYLDLLHALRHYYSRQRASEGLFVFVRVVQQKDTGTLVAVPGVGKRTAERILVDLEGKLDDWAPSAEVTELPEPIPDEPDIAAEAESALVALGYKPAEAARAVAGVNDGSLTTAEDLIRKALRATDGNRTHAAQLLEISHRALLYKLKEYGIR